MTRSLLMLTLLGWLSTSAAHAIFDGYLELSINLFEQDNGDLYSAASATCYTWLGNPGYDCFIIGEHYIFDTINQDQLGYRYYQTLYEYSGYIRRPPFNFGGDRCYRAKINGRIDGSGNIQYMLSPQRCILAGPIDHSDCPILIDLDTNGFHLSGIEEAVAFDLNADGVAEQHSWTSAGERDGFLCRDLNHNGKIDDGRELFGQETPLSTEEPAQIAYTALAELDLPELGGNSNGFIDAEDAAFGELCVWVDENHDGNSQPYENTSLQEAGIIRIDYRYTDSRRRDKHDNIFRYKSKAGVVGPSGRERITVVYDVYFRTP